MKKLLSTLLAVAMIASMLMVPLTVNALSTDAGLGDHHVFDLSAGGIYNYTPDGSGTVAPTATYNGTTYVPLHQINATGNSTAKHVDFVDEKGVTRDALKIVSTGVTVLTLTDHGVPFEAELNSTYTVKYDIYVSKIKQYHWCNVSFGGLDREWLYNEAVAWPNNYYCYGYWGTGYSNGNNLGYAYTNQFFYCGATPTAMQHYSGTKTVTVGDTFDIQALDKNKTPIDGKVYHENNFLQLVISGGLVDDQYNTIYVTSFEVCKQTAAPAVEFYDGAKLIDKKTDVGATYTVDRDAPAKEGYKFVGWYTNMSLNDAFSADSTYTFAGNAPVLSLFAKYVPISYIGTTELRYGTNSTQNVRDNSAMDYFTIDGSKYNSLPNRAYATKTYQADYLNISARAATSSAYTKIVTDENGVQYIRDVGGWGEGAPVVFTNPDGTVYQPAPNSRYRVTINYKHPNVANGIGNDYFQFFSGMRNAEAVLTSLGGKGTPLGGWGQSSTNSIYYTASDEMQTYTYVLRTGDFNGFQPCLGIFVNTSGYLGDTNDTYELDGVTYNRLYTSDFLLYNVSIEALSYEDLAVSRLVNAGSELGACGSVIVPTTPGVDCPMAEDLWYKAVFFDWDEADHCYKVINVVGAGYGMGKKGYSVPGNGFAYVIHEDKNNPNWENLSAPSFSLIGSGYSANNSSYLIGKKAYVYGMDLANKQINVVGSYNAAGFISNAYISIGKENPNGFAYDPTGDTRAGVDVIPTQINYTGTFTNHSMYIYTEDFGDTCPQSFSWWYGISAEWDEAQRAFVVNGVYHRDVGQANKAIPIPRNGFVLIGCDDYKANLKYANLGDVIHLYDIDLDNSTFGASPVVRFYSADVTKTPTPFELIDERLATPIFTNETAAGDILTTNEGVTISWNPVASAEGYRVIVNKANCEIFDEIAVAPFTTTATSFTFTPPADAVYGNAYTVSVYAYAAFFEPSSMGTASVRYVDAAKADTETAKKRIVFFGDSLTERVGYVNQVATDTSARTINAGVGGETTVNALKRFKVDVLDKNPTDVFICFGMNDAAAVKYLNFASYVPIDTYRANLVYFIDTLEAQGANVTLIIPSPVKASYVYYPEKTDWCYNYGYLEQFCNVMREVGVNKNCNMIDMYAEYNAYADHDSIYIDSIHQNADGHAFWAQKIENYLYATYDNVNAATMTVKANKLSGDTVASYTLSGSVGAQFLPVTFANLNGYTKVDGIDTADVSTLTALTDGAEKIYTYDAPASFVTDSTNTVYPSNGGYTTPVCAAAGHHYAWFDNAAFTGSAVTTFVPGASYYAATVADEAVVGAGASILTDAAAQAANNKQAIRVYYDYEVTNDGKVFYNGSYHDLKCRGVLLKSANNSAELTLTNCGTVSGLFKTAKTSNFESCWSNEGNVLRYSTYILGFELSDAREVTFRGYLILDDDTVVYTGSSTVSVSSIEKVTG